MFDQLFQQPSVIARHRNAPYADERERYLAHCARRGDSRTTLLGKARVLLHVARTLSVYPDLHVTIDQVRAAAEGRPTRGHPAVPARRSHWVVRQFIDVAGAWLRQLGYLRRPVDPIPFHDRLEEYAQWARHERGFSESTIRARRRAIAQFLRWYGGRGQALSALRVTDIDAYLTQGAARSWCRTTVCGVAEGLRAFFRFGADRGWAPGALAEAIARPRRYALAHLPAGPAWADVQRLLASVGTTRPKDVRDRAILMLLAMYGLRAREVTRLRLDDLDWEHDLLHVPRVKGHAAQPYPLRPAVGNAIIQYLEHVRPSSPAREVFLRLLSPHGPLSPQALYAVVAPRLKALGVRTVHVGPHALRHACATRLVASGFSLKAIGDQLGHRSTAATRIYAKVDLPGLREVAAFDLGGLL
jgi:integrase/recombinase XerD